MRILFVSDRRDGGIVSHVRCLQQCLPSEVETFTIGKGGDEEFAGKCGHDLREFWQMRRVIKAFRPDIVHFHIPALLMVLYVRKTQVYALAVWPSLLLSASQCADMERFEKMVCGYQW